MPKLKDVVIKEYKNVLLPLYKSGDTKATEKYTKEVHALIDEVANLLIDYVKRVNYPIDLVEELSEAIKDTSIIEGICAAENDFTNIEEFVLASKKRVFLLYRAMFDPELKFDGDKAIEYIMSPNSCDEENNVEILRWSRMLVQYMANGMDNEDEQLPKGSSKRKNNN